MDIETFTTFALMVAIWAILVRRCVLKAGIRHCDRFISNDIWGQFEHIKSEVREIEAEMNHIYLLHDEADMDKLAEEIVDLQTSCQTMLVILGADIDRIQRRVIAKNQVRGYYEKAVGE